MLLALVASLVSPCLAHGRGHEGEVSSYSLKPWKTVWRGPPWTWMEAKNLRFPNEHSKEGHDHSSIDYRRRSAVNGSGENTTGDSKCNQGAKPTNTTNQLQLLGLDDRTWSQSKSPYYTSGGLLIVSQTRSRIPGGVLHAPSLLMQSTDGGKNFKTLKSAEDSMSFIRVFMSNDHEQIIISFVKTTTQRGGVLVSSDGFKTWKEIDTPNGALIYLVEFNNKNRRRILAMDEAHDVFHSENLGLTWSSVAEKVLDFGWGGNSDDAVEMETTVYLTKETVASVDATGDKSQYALFRTDDFMESSQMISQDTFFFTIRKKFIFAFVGTRRSENSMKISSDGGQTFRTALFESKGALTLDQRFKVVAVDNADRILIAVEDPDSNPIFKPWSTLFIGSGDDIHFEVAMRGLGFVADGSTNFNKEEIIDIMFHEVYSSDHTFMALHRTDEGLRTKISFDFGSHWEPVRGSNENGELTDLELHQGLFADPKAPSIVGMNAFPKDNPQDTSLYFSHDGGKLFNKVLDGVYKVLSLDEGSVFVAIDTDMKTDSIWFSYEGGRAGTWNQLKVVSTPVFMSESEVDSGDRKMDLVIVSKNLDKINNAMTDNINNTMTVFDTVVINFDKILRECTDADYNSWSTGCYFGSLVSHSRRNLDSCCYNGDSAKRKPKEPETCACTVDDFQCAWGYIRDVDVNECIKSKTEKDAREMACEAGAETALLPTGNKKIAGNTCKGGVETTMLPSKIVPCSVVTPEDTQVSHTKDIFIVVLALIVTAILLCGIGFIAYKYRETLCKCEKFKRIQRFSIRADDENAFGSGNNDDDQRLVFDDYDDTNL